MNATTVVLYSDRNDPIALKALDEANPEIACIHVDQLIPLLSRRDWPKVLDIATTADIEAMFAGAKIINRAFTLSGTELSSCLSAWGVDERWFHVRLQDLLKLEVGCRMTPGSEGCRGRFSP